MENFMLELMDPTVKQVTPARMKAIVWNVRGANSKAFLWHALDIVKMHKPDILIILETKCSSLRADQATNRLGYSNFRIIHAFGKRRGIWLMWSADISLVHYVDAKPNHFHALFKLHVNAPEVLFTGMHAPSVVSDRNKYWVDLTKDSPPRGTPWLVAGDLNEVLNSNEKMGGKSVSHGQGRLCKDWMVANSLMDLGFQGPRFTWTNGRDGGAVIKERLDRALANAEWLDIFPDTKVIHLPRTFSDHCPILISFDDHHRPSSFPFRCKEAWVHHSDFLNVMESTWGCNKDNFLAARESFIGHVKEWNKYVFGSIVQQKKRVLTRL